MVFVAFEVFLRRADWLNLYFDRINPFQNPPVHLLRLSFWPTWPIPAIVFPRVFANVSSKTLSCSCYHHPDYFLADCAHDVPTIRVAHCFYC